MNDLYEILTREISDAQALENLANSVMQATEKTNKPGRKHSQEYAGSKDEIAGSARQLAELVLQALGNLTQRKADSPKAGEKCSFDPSTLTDVALGMFHCPQCGEMVMAGVPHPDYSLIK